MTAPQQPVQIALSAPQVFIHNQLRLEALAQYHIQARVLGRRNYHWDHEAKVSPFDFVLGWDVMSDNDVTRRIRITQRSRWYYWHTPSWHVTRAQIERNSANVHIIPANDTLRSQLDRIRKGDVIRMSGYLVNVYDGNWRWRTSLSRNDVGNGACEVFYVQQVAILKD